MTVLATRPRRQRAIVNYFGSLNNNAPYVVLTVVGGFACVFMCLMGVVESIIRIGPDTGDETHNLFFDLVRFFPLFAVPFAIYCTRTYAKYVVPYQYLASVKRANLAYKRLVSIGSSDEIRIARLAMSEIDLLVRHSEPYDLVKDRARALDELSTSSAKLLGIEFNDSSIITTNALVEMKNKRQANEQQLKDIRDLNKEFGIHGK